nr:MAG TPA_asm: Nuclease [Caudoviricetes sp.]
MLPNSKKTAMKKSIKNIVEHAEVSEKSIERYLCDAVKKLGGVCLKYSNANMVGYPDRVALMPGGHCIWFELKSKGRKTSKVQDIRIAQLESIGHTVYVCDSKQSINNVLADKGYDI